MTRDITELRAMEERLRVSQKLESLGVLAGGIAHDFNNLLGGILGYWEIVRDNIDNRTYVLNVMKKAEKVFDRTTDLTNQLLTFSKGGDPKRINISVGEFLEESRSLAFSGSNIICKMRLSPDLKNVFADKGQLHQVINNIFVNARQAMPTGGSVVISAQNMRLSAGNVLQLESGEYVEIVISDNGIGIPAKILDRVFDPFFSTKSSGSGLGLAMCYSIIEKHKGRITIASELDKGTSVRILLKAGTGAAELDVGQATKGSRFSGRVLVMDDEEIIREIASEILRTLGVEVVCAKGGQEAIEIIRQATQSELRFDLVLLDLTIPGGMGGIETMSEIRKLDSNVVGVVMSGYGDNDAISDPRKNGFSDSVKKPFRCKDLVRVLEHTLGRQSVKLT